MLSYLRNEKQRTGIALETGTARFIDGKKINVVVIVTQLIDGLPKINVIPASSSVNSPNFDREMLEEQKSFDSFEV